LVKEELQNAFKELEKLENSICQILENYKDCLENIKSEIKETYFKDLPVGEILSRARYISQIISSYFLNLLTEDHIILDFQGIVDLQ